MKIAVYSGSFNPLHIGHQAIMECISDGDQFDHIYLVVSPQSPFKDASNALTGEDRFNAAVAALERHPEIKATAEDIELHLDPPNYTIRTLDALKAREPENEFTLIIGSDNLDCFLGWREAERILTEYGVAVYPRRGYDTEAIAKNLMEMNPDFRIQILDAPMVDISSTQVREGMKNGEDMSQYLM